MKRYLLFFLFFISMTSNCFSSDIHLLGIGVEIPFLSELVKFDDEVLSTTLHGTGLSATGFSFWNDKKIGLFTRLGFIWPTYSNIDGIVIDPTTFDHNFMFSTLIGPAFRSSPNETFQLYAGLGIHFISFTVKNSTVDPTISSYVFNFGIGGEYSMITNINESVFTSFGITLAYDFLNFTSVTNGTSTVYGDYDSYRAFWFKPHIEIGYKFKNKSY